MTFTEFLNIAKSIQSRYATSHGGHVMAAYMDSVSKKEPGKRTSVWDNYLYSEDFDSAPWTGFLNLAETGGVSGGSCWENSDPQPYSTGKEAAGLPQLEDFLMEVCPQISYLHYLKISRLIEPIQFTEYEYYGNCSEYRGQYLAFETLYKVMLELKLLP